MKRWTRILPFLCLWAALCLTLAAADFTPTPLNCHEMTAMMFGAPDGAELLGRDGAEAALADYFAAREAAYRGDATLLSSDAPEMGAAVAEGNALRVERVGEMEARLGLTVLDADVTARIDRERTTHNPDGTLTLYVYEWTFYDYDDLSDGAGGLDVSGFGTWHILTVAERPDGSFAILADEYDESDILGINTLSEARQREALDRASQESDEPYAAEPMEDDASLLAISYYPDYNVSAAVAYSEKYWTNYNPAYANFNGPNAGDCANFTSQSIAAGGMPQVVTKPYASDGWYYKTASDRSATWPSSTALRKWMAANRGHLTTASKSTVYAASPVFYSTKADGTFQHTVLCVGTNSAGTPVINSHNSDRYHVMWNYYTGSKIIDTVQLTSEKFGDFSGYVSIGPDVYAQLYAHLIDETNRSVTKDCYVTNDGEGSVSSRAKADSDGQAAQVWHFVRQDDGSYQILSVKHDGTQDKPALAVTGGAWDSRTYICTEEDAASPGQRWYVYWDKENNAYLLRPKCSDRVIDIEEGSLTDGAKLWLFSRNGSEAQLFQIYELEWVELEKPVLDVKMGGGEGSNVMFSWTPVEGAVSYVLRITNPAGNFNREISIGKTSSYAMRLEPSPQDYEATLEAFSANKRTSSISDAKTFKVNTSFTITFSSNGGESAPPAQLKVENVDAELTTELPVRKGYAFVSWSTKANGIGATYDPGAVYAIDEDVTLYAQWTPGQFTVTLNTNVGPESETSECVVTYKEPYGELPGYGELPAPTRAGLYAFGGWYTDPTEGELVTAETIVTTPENHTLYAHWNSTAVYLLPDVRKSGERHQVVTALHQIPPGVLFACGYFKGQLVDAVSGTIAENQTEVTLDLEGTFDKILVMAFDGTSSMRPTCKAEAVTKF